MTFADTAIGGGLESGSWSSALVTGASGFVGSRLVRALLGKGTSVHAVLRPDSQTRELPSNADGLSIHRWDGSPGGMGAILQRAQPQIVFHLASLVLPVHKSEDIPRLIDANIVFGTQLLDALARTSPQTPLVNAGTSWEHFHDAPYLPVNLYAATKHAFEAILAYYADAHGLRAVTLKLFDTYGPADPRSKLIPLLLRAARENKMLDLSPGEQRLDLLYIDDVVEGFIAAGTRAASLSAGVHEPFALSSGGTLSIRELVAILERVIHRPVPVRFGARPYREREVMRPWTTGAALPDWKPRIPLAEGLARCEAAPL